jgi:hypothetical protein
MINVYFWSMCFVFNRFYLKHHPSCLKWYIAFEWFDVIHFFRAIWCDTSPSSDLVWYVTFERFEVIRCLWVILIECAIFVHVVMTFFVYLWSLLSAACCSGIHLRTYPMSCVFFRSEFLFYEARCLSLSEVFEPLAFLGCVSNLWNAVLVFSSEDFEPLAFLRCVFNLWNAVPLFSSVVFKPLVFLECVSNLWNVVPLFSSEVFELYKGWANERGVW